MHFTMIHYISRQKKECKKIKFFVLAMLGVEIQNDEHNNKRWRHIPLYGHVKVLKRRPHARKTLAKTISMPRFNRGFLIEVRAHDISLSLSTWFPFGAVQLAQIYTSYLGRHGRVVCSQLSLETELKAKITSWTIRKSIAQSLQLIK